MLLSHLIPTYFFFLYYPLLSIILFYDHNRAAIQERIPDDRFFLNKLEIGRRNKIMPKNNQEYRLLYYIIIWFKHQRRFKENAYANSRYLDFKHPDYAGSWDWLDAARKIKEPRRPFAIVRIQNLSGVI